MYLVMGGSGFLGRYIVKNILELTQDTIVATYSSTKPVFQNERLKWVRADVQNRADIDNINSIIEEGAKVIYLCAYHHPDKVEENPRLAWDINITSLAYVVNALTKAACFYYSSTDTVYGEGGLDILFKENDKTNPVNLYGKHKVLAEEITLAKGFNVVRFPFIIGTSLVESKKHFFDKILEDIKNGKCVEMFSDSYRSTLSFNQCAKYLIQLIEKYGACEEKVINISSDKPLSKYEVVLKMCDDFNLDKTLVKPISINNCEGIFKAKRAKSAVLDNSKIKKLLGYEKIELEWE